MYAIRSYYGVSIDIDTLLFNPPAIRKRMLRLALQMGFGLKDLTQGHVDDLIMLAKKRESGKRIELPHGVCAAVEYGKLRIGKNKGKTYNETSVVITSYSIHYTKLYDRPELGLIRRRRRSLPGRRRPARKSVPG